MKPVEEEVSGRRSGMHLSSQLGLLSPPTKFTIRLSSEKSRKHRKPKATRILVLLHQFHLGIYSSCPRQPHAGFAHLRLQRSLERSLAGKGNPSAYPTSFAATPARPVMLSGHGICSFLACSSAPTHSASASRHSNASCSASRYASRNLTPFPSSSLETSRRFPSKEVCKKVMGTPTKRVSVSFLHKRGPRRSNCSAVSCLRPSAKEAG